MKVEQSGRDDDHHVVTEAGESFRRGNDPGYDGREQGKHGHYVIAQTTPYEEDHHRSDNRKGESLLQAHCSHLSVRAWISLPQMIICRVRASMDLPYER
jgi:hypothetical protein